MNSPKYSFGKRMLSVLLLIIMISGVFSAAFGFFSSFVKAADDEYDVQVYNLTIYYYAKNTTTEIYPHFHATYAEGESYEITSPTVSGYEIEKEEQQVISGTLEQDTVIKVYYTVGQRTAAYTVNYYTMDNTGSNITLNDTITGTAEINEVITVPLIVIEGYSWTVSDLLLTVTADGHAVKNLYYIESDERTLVFRTGNGYAQTISADPGTDITKKVEDILDEKNKPTKEGYNFIRWEPELEPNENGRYIMPENDVVISAVWESYLETYYNVEFWFEKIDSDDAGNPANYAKIDALNEQRLDKVGKVTKPTIKDRLIADQMYLYRNSPLNTDVFSSAERRAEDFTSNVEAAAGEIKSQYTDEEYVSSCEFFGFDYAFAESTTVVLDGTGVMRLYYSRENWTINIWEHPCTAGGVGENFEVPNTLWKSFEGKYNSPLPSDFPKYDDLAAHYNGREVDNEFTLYATNCSSDKADQLSILFYDSTFSLFYGGKNLKGTYTWVDGSTWSENQLTMTAENGDSITATFGTDGKDYFTLKVDGNKITNASNGKFYKSSYLGIVEQNYSKEAEATQNVSFFRTAQNILDGTLNFYPKYTSNNIVVFKRIIYSMPLESNGGFSQNVDVASLTEIMNRTTGASAKNKTNILTTAYVGYTLTGGKYRIKTRQDSTQPWDWNDSETWADIKTSSVPDTGPACFINESSGILTLLRGGTDCYFEVQLAPVSTNMKFMNGSTAVKPNYYTTTSSYNTSTGIYSVQYTEPLDFLYRKDASGNLMTDADGEYIWNYYLTDPTGNKLFDGWYLDGGLTEPVTPDFCCRQTKENATWNIYAKWRPAKATITFDSMGGSSVPAQTVYIGQSATEPTPTKEHFAFVGWYTENNVPYNFNAELTKDITLYAKWKPLNLAQYTVKHILINGGNEMELSQYTQTGFGTVGDTVSVSALDASCVTAGGIGYYIAVDQSTDATQSIELKSDPNENIAIFYYRQQTSWSYKVSYLDRNGTPLLSDKVVDDVDVLYVTEAAKRINGYAMINCDGKENSGINVYGQRGKGYVSASISASGNSQLYIYYDKLYILSFDLQGGTYPDGDANPYANRSLLYKETTSIPKAPEYEGHIFLGWNTAADGSGTMYRPGVTYSMPENDVTVYAQWADATAIKAPGRLLDRLVTNDDESKIAENGAVTALFSINEQNNIQRIAPNDMYFLTTKAFPVGTVMTMIVYPDEVGQLGASYYYYKVGTAATKVALTDFNRMGSETVKFSSAKVSSFRCQVCVEYPGNASNSTICLSIDENKEPATALDIEFKDSFELPVGNISATANTEALGKLSTTVTVSGLGNFEAEPSDSRHTHGTLPDYKAVLVIALKNENGNSVPFPEKSTVSVDGIPIKTGSTDDVKGILTKAVGSGNYIVTATGLPTDEKIKVCLSLYAANSSIDNQTEHPMLRAPLDTAEVSLASPQVKYAIRAELRDSDYRIFKISELSAGKTLTFDIDYSPENSSDDITIKSYIKESGAYNTEMSWAWNIPNRSSGKAIATVTIPENTIAGTYRLVFAIGDAEYNLNLIVIED